MQRGLQSMRPVAGRLEVKQALRGARLIDDAYNANPGSLRVGLRALAGVPGERWLVLGEMAELGEEGPRLHAEMGALARECGVTRLLAVGDGSQPAVESFGPGASWHSSTDELLSALLPDAARRPHHLRQGLAREPARARHGGARAGRHGTGRGH